MAKGRITYLYVCEFNKVERYRRNSIFFVQTKRGFLNSFPKKFIINEKNTVFQFDNHFGAILSKHELFLVSLRNSSYKYAEK